MISITNKGGVSVEDLYNEIVNLSEEKRQDFIFYLEKLNNQDSEVLPAASPG